MGSYLLQVLLYYCTATIRTKNNSPHPQQKHDIPSHSAQNKYGMISCRTPQRHRQTLSRRLPNKYPPRFTWRTADPPRPLLSSMRIAFATAPGTRMSISRATSTGSAFGSGLKRARACTVAGACLKEPSCTAGNGEMVQDQRLLLSESRLGAYCCGQPELVENSPLARLCGCSHLQGADNSAWKVGRGEGVHVLGAFYLVSLGGTRRFFNRQAGMKNSGSGMSPPAKRYSEGPDTCRVEWAGTYEKKYHGSNKRPISCGLVKALGAYPHYGGPLPCCGYPTAVLRKQANFSTGVCCTRMPW